MKFLLRQVAFVGLCGATLAEAAPAGFAMVSDDCRLAAPRFPASYAKRAELRKASGADRLHTVSLGSKKDEVGANVEATLHEIDLNGDGVCDLVVTMRDPVSSGGDSDVLSTVYLAGNRTWKRLGAVTAKRDDLPSSLDLTKSAQDEDYAFSDHAVLRDLAANRTYLIGWHSERVTNGFDGYRLYEMDAAKGELRVVDKWTGDGAKTYAAFKSLSAGPAQRFDANVEADELRAVCPQAGTKSDSLRAACAALPR